MATTPRKIRRYGYIPDIPDHRDLVFAPTITRLPAKVDMRAHCPAIMDQGQLGSCTANGISFALQFDQLKQKEADVPPSRLFIYYNERAIEGTTSEDAGAMIRDGIKSVASTGACPETVWPYDISKFADQPPATAYTAANLKALKYQRVTGGRLVISHLRAALAAGHPVVVGITVYPSFESPTVARTGHVPMPGPSEAPIGGHCIAIVGYDDKLKRFILANSWGSAWGMKGYFTLPYDYFTAGLASDMWVVTQVS